MSKRHLVLYRPNVAACGLKDPARSTPYAMYTTCARCLRTVEAADAEVLQNPSIIEGNTP